MPPTPTAYATGLAPSFPQGLCCNCGTPHDLASREVGLVVERFLDSSVWRVPALLPSCARCAPSLIRPAPGFPLIGASFGALFALVFIGAVGLTVVQGWEVDGVTVAFSAVVAGILVGLWYGRRKPTGAQTSYYQPVRLLKVHQTFLGATTGLTLGFTHAGYANAVAALLGTGTPGDTGALRTVEWTAPPVQG